MSRGGGSCPRWGEPLRGSNEAEAGQDLSMDDPRKTATERR
jgi:hypothetical protein